MSEWAKAEGLNDIDCLATDTGTVGNSDAWVMPQASRNTLALLQYTSGSIGDPKGVMVSHYNLIHNAASVRRVLGFTEQTRFGGWIPLYHDMGLMAQLLHPLFLGSTCVMMTPATFLKRPHLWLRMIDKYDINYSCAPNFAFDLCRRRITDKQIADMDLSRWEFAINGSEPVQAATIRAFADRFAAAGFREEAICPCYGMAEATVFISGFSHRPPLIRRVNSDLLKQNEFCLETSGHNARNLVSCGVARDYDVRIVDPKTGEVLPAGHVGEILVRGESVSQGYWRNEEATNTTFRAVTSDGDTGYLRTGDLGVCYEDELYITGRLKEVLIINGRNLYPQDIEHEIRARYDDLSSRFGAAFTVPVPDEGEVIIVTHEIHGSVVADRLKDIVAGIKVTVQQEFGVRVSGVLLLRPGGVLRTTSGKIQRSAMRERFLDNGLLAVYEDLDPQVQALIKLQRQCNAPERSIAASPDFELYA